MTNDLAKKYVEEGSVYDGRATSDDLMLLISITVLEVRGHLDRPSYRCRSISDLEEYTYAKKYTPASPWEHTRRAPQTILEKLEYLGGQVLDVYDRAWRNGGDDPASPLLRMALDQIEGMLSEIASSKKS